MIVVRDRLFKPIVVAADSHFEDATHHLHAVLVSMGFDEKASAERSFGDLMLGLRHRSAAKSGC